METREYTDFKLSANTTDKGHYILLSIDKVWIAKGYNNSNEEVVVFSERFNNLDEVDRFKETQLYKLVFDAIKKAV